MKVHKQVSLINYTTQRRLIPTLFKFFQKLDKDTKTRQRHHKKGKLQAIIPDAQRCKISQQNIREPNSIIH